MLRPLLISLLVALLLPQATSPKKDEPAEPYVDLDAYDVYAAILPSEWPLSVAHARSLVIGGETTGYKMCLVPDMESEALVGAAISDYVKKNEKSWTLQPLLSLDVPYLLITADEFKSVAQRGAWKTFNEQHPNTGGVIALSAVGFNADKTVAVVYMEHSCGGDCGGGGFHVLQKKDGKWLPLKWKGTSCAWDS